MKRPLLLLLAVVLVVFELFLLEEFLPYQYQHAISVQMERAFLTPRYDPHPNMDWEIETVLQQHPSYRIALYLITLAMATGNAFLIAKVWKIRGRLARPSDRT
jgi:hypothetical protein